MRIFMKFQHLCFWCHKIIPYGPNQRRQKIIETKVILPLKLRECLGLRFLLCVFFGRSFLAGRANDFEVASFFLYVYVIFLLVEKGSNPVVLCWNLQVVAFISVGFLSMRISPRENLFYNSSGPFFPQQSHHLIKDWLRRRDKTIAEIHNGRVETDE
jgi:hypothetical protein